MVMLKMTGMSRGQVGGRREDKRRERGVNSLGRRIVIVNSVGICDKGDGQIGRMRLGPTPKCDGQGEGPSRVDRGRKGGAPCDGEHRH